MKRILPALLLGLAIPSLAADPAPATADELAAVHKRMGDHFMISWKARAAVLRGDVEGAKEQGKKLAALSYSEMPDTWKPHLAELQQVGREFAGVPNVAMAGKSVGQMGQVCADCHKTTKGGPKLEGDTSPPPAWSEGTHMNRHLWASEWMWLGVIAADDTAFLRGAKALADGPFKDVGPRSDTHAKTAEADTHRIAQEMVAAKTLDDRIGMYGALLGQCGTCHLALEAEGATPQ